MNAESKTTFTFSNFTDPVTQKEQTEKITLAGIQTILPVIDSSLLQYSSLSSAYYRLLSLASSYSPQIIIEFHQPVWELILSSILLSLDSRCVTVY